MKRIIFIILILLATSAYAGQPSRIILATHDLCPYGCSDTVGQFDGQAVRVVRYALEMMEVELELVVVPWNRAQYLVSIGQADGFFAASRNPERDLAGVMSEPVAEQKWVWYLLKDNPLDPSAENFMIEAKVTSFHGANMLKWLRETGFNVVTPSRDTETLTNMLLAKRFDAMLGNNLVMEEIIRNKGLHGKLKSLTAKDKPLGVYFSNAFVEDNPGFVEEFNGHVKTYRADHMEQ